MFPFTPWGPTWWHWKKFSNIEMPKCLTAISIKNAYYFYQKRSVARTLLDRETSIPSTDEEEAAKLQRVTTTLLANGYTTQFLKSCQLNGSRDSKTRKDQELTRNFVVLPYTRGISEKNHASVEPTQHKSGSYWITPSAPLGPSSRDPKVKQSKFKFKFSIMPDYHQSIFNLYYISL